MKYNSEEIRKVLPYDYPFLLVDSIEEIVGNKIVAKKNLSNDQLFFKGHFKDFPIMPGVLLLESIGQTGSFYIRKKLNKKDIDVLAYEIKDAKFIKPSFPGDTLIISVELEEDRKNIWIAKGEVMVEKQKVAQASFYLYVTKKKEFRKKCS